MSDTVMPDVIPNMMGDIIHLIESLSALKSISSLSCQERSLDDMMHEALRILMDNEEMESCSIFLVREDNLINAAGLGWNDVLADKQVEGVVRRATTHFRVGEGLMGLAAATGETQHARDCTTDTRFKTINGGSGRSVQGSVICTPIRVGGCTVGVLNVSHSSANYFTEWHERLLSVFCDVLGQSYHSRKMLLRFENEVAQRTMNLERALAVADELKKRYEILCITDDLTELHNRRYFFREFEAELSRSIRHENELCLLILDIDNFKFLNDKYGHLLGDKVLREVGAVLKAHIRGGDILARYGGEEFVIALPFTDNHGAKILGERIRDAISQMRPAQLEESCSVTVSIGVSYFSGDTEKPTGQLLEELIEQADRALYYCKNHGRNKVCSFGDIEQGS